MKKDREYAFEAQELIQERITLEKKLLGLEEKRKELYTNSLNLKSDQVRIVKNDFISITCRSMKELKKCLAEIQPFKNDYTLAHKEPIQVICLYRVDLVNDYGQNLMRVMLETIAGVQYWITIDFKHTPLEFKRKFFVNYLRGLYSSESHYVQASSGKKFEEMRVSAVRSQSKHVSWYGGNHTLTDSTEIYNIIEYIKKKE